MKNVNNIKKLALTLLISGLFVGAGNSFFWPANNTSNDLEINKSINQGNFQEAFINACKYLRIEKINEIIQKYKDKININKEEFIRDVYDQTPQQVNPILHEAILGYMGNLNEKYIELVKILFNNGLNIKFIHQAKDLMEKIFENRRLDNIKNNPMYIYLNNLLKPKPLEITPRAEKYHDANIHTK